MTVSCNIKDCKLNKSNLCSAEHLIIRNGQCFNLYTVNGQPRPLDVEPKFNIAEIEIIDYEEEKESEEE